MTMRCVRSVLDAAPKEKVIVVVDNGSGDGSVEAMSNGLMGECGVVMAPDCDGLDIERCRKTCIGNVVILALGENKGFAAGNNVGAAFCLERLASSYIWILNNDTVVFKNSLSCMIEEFESADRIGFVGSVIAYVDRPNIMQCYGGGRTFPLLARSKLVGKGMDLARREELSGASVDYLSGASMLVRREVFQECGGMDEDYFMYAEEKDWQLRARRYSWDIAIAANSIVLHEESSSTRRRREFYYYLFNRSTMMFSKRNYGRLTTIIGAAVLFVITCWRTAPILRNCIYGAIGIYDGLFSKAKRF